MNMSMYTCLAGKCQGKEDYGVNEGLHIFGTVQSNTCQPETRLNKSGTNVNAVISIS